MYLTDRTDIKKRGCCDRYTLLSICHAKAFGINDLTINRYGSGSTPAFAVVYGLPDFVTGCGNSTFKEFCIPAASPNAVTVSSMQHIQTVPIILVFDIASSLFRPDKNNLLMKLEYRKISLICQLNVTENVRY
jgi:hypothetical protein